MTLTISIRLNGSSAKYEVKHEIDGIYKATLLNKGHDLSNQFPEKIILIRSNGSWTFDCLNKVIGLKIGQTINTATLNSNTAES
jgi:hypothetical protein